MRTILTRTGFLIGALNFTLTHASTMAKDGESLIISAGAKALPGEPDIKPRSKEYQYQHLLDEDTAEPPQSLDSSKIYLAVNEKQAVQPSRAAEYWREINVVFEAPTPASDASHHCGMLITPAPILLARQDDAGELAALSNSAAAASRSASAGIQNAEISASNAIASVSRTASESISSASSSATSVSLSAASALSSMSSLLSSVESSASSAVSAANSSVSSALMAASILAQAASESVDAAGSSFLVAISKATSDAQGSIQLIGAAATQIVAQSQAKASQDLAISSTNAAIAIVVSIFGSTFVTALIFFFIIQYRKKRLVDRERDKCTSNHRGRGPSHRESKSSLGSYYKDEKSSISAGSGERSRSRSRYRRERERSRGTRRERRSSNDSDSQQSRSEKDSSLSRAHVASSPRSPIGSVSDYSSFPRDSFISKPHARTKAPLSEIYPTPKTPQTPQMKLFNSSAVIRRPEKMALKSERVNTLTARKNLVSMGPATGSTSNNFSTWLRDQTERKSISPTFRKAGLGQPLSRTGIERPRIQIPVPMQGEIVDFSRSDSNSSLRTSQFPEGFIGKDESEGADRENGKSAIEGSPARDGTTDLSRDSGFPFKKEGQTGVKVNSRGITGLPANPRSKRSVRESAAKTVAFQTFEGLSRVEGGPSLVVPRTGKGGDVMWPRASQVGRAS